MAMREVRPGYWKGEIWQSGRRKTICFQGGATEAKLYEASQRLAIEKSGVVPSRSSPTFASFCVDHYKPYAKLHLRKRTWENVRRYQVETLGCFFKETRLTEIREPLIDAYKVERCKSVGKTTVNAELSVLSAILTYARETLKVPCSHPKITQFRVRPKKGRIKFWTLDELQHLLDTCMEVAPSIFPLVLFLAQTGARKSEAIHLPWSRVDFKARIVRIWAETSVDDDEEDDPYAPKSVEREVPISEALFTVLGELKLRGGGEFAFGVRQGKRKGQAYEYFPKATFRKVVKEAKLEGGPHKLRHTYASNFLAKKPDLFLLGRLLGHSHARVTELYSHLVPGYLEEARDIIDVTVPVRPIPQRKPRPLPRPSRSKRVTEAS